jgi:actin related protein 2/3 complex subunit 4
MAQSHQNYLKAIRDALDASLCLRFLPSQEVERQSHPEIEFGESPKLIMNSLVISRNEQEACLIEGSVNSCRISFSIKKNELVEELLSHML